MARRSRSSELDQFWSKALAAYKAAVEEPSEEVP
jgi:hypothetical protein